jgi:hypothetical protein
VSPRVSVQREWLIRDARAIEPAVDEVARAHGLTAAFDRGAVVLRGGSQATTGFFPGALITDRALPTRGRLERSRTADGFTLVRLRLEDALGSAPMDAGLRSRYARVLASIARGLQARLAAATEVHDVGEPATG